MRNFDDIVNKIVYRIPLSRQNGEKIIENLKYAEMLKDYIAIYDGVVNDVNSELMRRKIKAEAGPEFNRNDKVKVIGHLSYWPLASSLQPPIGITGRIIGKKKIDSKYDIHDQLGLYEVEFLSSDVGYIWNEGDDEDRKYSRAYMNNWALEKIIEIK